MNNITSFEDLNKYAGDPPPLKSKGGSIPSLEQCCMWCDRMYLLGRKAETNNQMSVEYVCYMRFSRYVAERIMHHSSYLLPKYSELRSTFREKLLHAIGRLETLQPRLREYYSTVEVSRPPPKEQDVPRSSIEEVEEEEEEVEETPTILIPVLLPTRPVYKEEDPVVHDDDSPPPVFKSSLLKNLRTSIPGPVVLKSQTVRGLVNTNNTCWFNSVIQCLSNTAQLRTHYMTGNVVGDINIGLSKLIKKLYHEENNSPTSPKEMVDLVRKRIPSLNKKGRHQDAHEFLVHILDQLHMEIGQDSVINKTFGGQMTSVVNCTTCKHKSITMEDFTFLHLDIGSGGALESLLKIFFNEEEVDYVCEECRAHTKSLRRSSLSRLPQVLIIVLKRFSQIQGWKTVKNESKVVFPETGLDVYGSRYDCYAIVNHEGSLNFGHYTACVKMSHAVRSGERAWHKYNDGKVSKMNSLNPKGSTEYILFYEMAKN